LKVRTLGFMFWLPILALVFLVLGRTLPLMGFPLSVWALILPGIVLTSFYIGAFVVWMRLVSGAVVGDIPPIRDSVGTSPELYTVNESPDEPGQTVLNTGGATVPGLSSWHSKNAFVARADSVERFGKHYLLYGVFKPLPGDSVSGMSPEGMDVLLSNQLSGFLPKRGKVWYSALNSLVEGETESRFTKEQSELVDLQNEVSSRLWSLVKHGDKLLLDMLQSAMKQAKRRTSRLSLPPVEVGGETAEGRRLDEGRKQ